MNKRHLNSLVRSQYDSQDLQHRIKDEKENFVTVGWTNGRTDGLTQERTDERMDKVRSRMALHKTQKILWNSN